MPEDQIKNNTNNLKQPPAGPAGNKFASLSQAPKIRNSAVKSSESEGSDGGFDLPSVQKRITGFLKSAGSSGPTQLDQGETNLIKGREVLFLNWGRKLNFLAASFVVSGIMVGLMFGGVIGWSRIKQDDLRELETKMKDKDEQIEQLEAKNADVFIFQKKLRLAKELLANHVYWTNFFDFLEKNTLPDVYYGAFSGDLSGNYSLGARANDFNMVADQLEVFNANEFVKSATTLEGKNEYSKKIIKDPETGAEREESQSQVTFELRLEVDPMIFNKQKKTD